MIPVSFLQPLWMLVAEDKAYSPGDYSPSRHTDYVKSSAIELHPAVAASGAVTVASTAVGEEILSCHY